MIEPPVDTTPELGVGPGTLFQTASGLGTLFQTASGPELPDEIVEMIFWPCPWRALVVSRCWRAWAIAKIEKTRIVTVPHPHTNCYHTQEYLALGRVARSIYALSHILARGKYKCWHRFGSDPLTNIYSVTFRQDITVTKLYIGKYVKCVSISAHNYHLQVGKFVTFSWIDGRITYEVVGYRINRRNRLKRYNYDHTQPLQGCDNTGLRKNTIVYRRVNSNSWLKDARLIICDDIVFQQFITMLTTVYRMPGDLRVRVHFPLGTAD